MDWLIKASSQSIQNNTKLSANKSALSYTYTLNSTIFPLLEETLEQYLTQHFEISKDDGSGVSLVQSDSVPDSIIHVRENDPENEYTRFINFLRLNPEIIARLLYHCYNDNDLYFRLLRVIVRYISIVLITSRDDKFVADIVRFLFMSFSVPDAIDSLVDLPISKYKILCTSTMVLLTSLPSVSEYLGLVFNGIVLEAVELSCSIFHTKSKSPNTGFLKDDIDLSYPDLLKFTNIFIKDFALYSSLFPTPLLFILQRIRRNMISGYSEETIHGCCKYFIFNCFLLPILLNHGLMTVLSQNLIRRSCRKIFLRLNQIFTILSSEKQVEEIDSELPVSYLPIIHACDLQLLGETFQTIMDRADKFHFPDQYNSNNKCDLTFNISLNDINVMIGSLRLLSKANDTAEFNKVLYHELNKFPEQLNGAYEGIVEMKSTEQSNFVRSRMLKIYPDQMNDPKAIKYSLVQFSSPSDSAPASTGIALRHGVSGHQPAITISTANQGLAKSKQSSQLSLEQMNVASKEEFCDSLRACTNQCASFLFFQWFTDQTEESGQLQPCLLCQLSGLSGTESSAPVSTNRINGSNKYHHLRCRQATSYDATAAIDQSVFSLVNQKSQFKPPNSIHGSLRRFRSFFFDAVIDNLNNCQLTSHLIGLVTYSPMVGRALVKQVNDACGTEHCLGGEQVDDDDDTGGDHQKKGLHENDLKLIHILNILILEVNDLEDMAMLNKLNGCLQLAIELTSWWASTYPASTSKSKQQQSQQAPACLNDWLAYELDLYLGQENLYLVYLNQLSRARSLECQRLAGVQKRLSSIIYFQTAYQAINKLASFVNAQEDLLRRLTSHLGSIPPVSAKGATGPTKKSHELKEKAKTYALNNRSPIWSMASDSSNGSFDKLKAMRSSVAIVNDSVGGISGGHKNKKSEHRHRLCQCILEIVKNHAALQLSRQSTGLGSIASGTTIGSLPGQKGGSLDTRLVFERLITESIYVSGFWLIDYDHKSELDRNGEQCNHPTSPSHPPSHTTQLRPRYFTINLDFIEVYNEPLVGEDAYIFHLFRNAVQEVKRLYGQELKIESFFHGKA